MGNDDLEHFSREGERADELARQGRHPEAQKAYLELLKQFESQGQVDGFLAAKAALGLIVSYCKSGLPARAFAAWNANMEDSLLGLGVYALESAQAGVADIVRYDMVCAYLHSISDAPAERSAKAINQYLSRVAQYAIDESDRPLLAQVLSNWKAHLREAFGAAIPHAFARALIAYERKLGAPSPAAPIDFLAPSSWEMPTGLVELTGVAAWGAAAGNRPFRAERKRRKA